MAQIEFARLGHLLLSGGKWGDTKLIDTDVPDPGPWVYEGPGPPAGLRHLIEPALPPFEVDLPPWLLAASYG